MISPCLTRTIVVAAAIVLSPGDDPDQPDRFPVSEGFVDRNGCVFARQDVRIGEQAESPDEIEAARGIGKLDRTAIPMGWDFDKNVHPKSVITMPHLSLVAPR